MQKTIESNQILPARQRRRENKKTQKEMNRNAINTHP